ncbi:MAG: hypothetical protein KDA92_08090 [Planctomycetales bacterium]|nr:hypothetical protein [Planctomycetales bacterium]MCA9166175.1 hypothetical protein [Planctomycetales bacterium]
MNSTRGSVSYWLNELKDGNEAAVTAIWQCYFQTLVTVARRNLKRSTSRMADEEDVALSAFDSFVRGVDRGNFAQLEDRNDLWRLLLVITLRKAADQTNRELRKKRGGGRVRGESDLDGNSIEFSMDDMLSREPTPAVEAMIRDQLIFLFRRLADPQLQSIAIAKMEGQTDAEIAAQHACARRTIARKLAVIRELWVEEAAS